MVGVLILDRSCRSRVVLNGILQPVVWRCVYGRLLVLTLALPYGGHLADTYGVHRVRTPQYTVLISTCAICKYLKSTLVVPVAGLTLPSALPACCMSRMILNSRLLADVFSSIADDAGRVRVRHGGQPRVLPHLPARGPPCGRGVLRTGTHHPGAGDGWGTSHRLPHRYAVDANLPLTSPRPDRTDPVKASA